MKKIGILGAAGRVGGRLTEILANKDMDVRAVIRNPKKATVLTNKNIEVAVANYNDEAALTIALNDTNTVFLLTPENPECNDFIAETRLLLDTYRSAILNAGVKRVIGLSSMGAQHCEGTGNLLASYMLEHLFDNVAIQCQFVRPAYYFSNWAGYMDIVKQFGILPTFFPPNLKLPMIAPSDVAAFCASLIAEESPARQIFEIEGPDQYSSEDIAASFGEKLDREVILQTVAPVDWEKTLLSSGFSKSGAENLALMTKAVVDGKTVSESETVKMPTSFRAYLDEIF